MGTQSAKQYSSRQHFFDGDQEKLIERIKLKKEWRNAVLRVASSTKVDMDLAATCPSSSHASAGSVWLVSESLPASGTAASGKSSCPFYLKAECDRVGPVHPVPNGHRASADAAAVGRGVDQQASGWRCDWRVDGALWLVGELLKKHPAVLGPWFEVVFIMLQVVSYVSVALMPRLRLPADAVSEEEWDAEAACAEGTSASSSLATGAAEAKPAEPAAAARGQRVGAGGVNLLEMKAASCQQHQRSL